MDVLPALRSEDDLRREEGVIMTVQEFYDWCKKRKLTEAVMEIGLKFAGAEVKEENIDYGLTGLPHKTEKFIRLGW